MPPSTTWLSQLNKCQIELNHIGYEWKDLMKECLMKTEIFDRNFLHLPNEKPPYLDPNIIMNIRHKMIKTQVFSKPFPIPKEQIQTEAVKILKDENYKRLFKQKEKNMVEKEIYRLKKKFENYNVAKKIEEFRNGKRKGSKVAPTFAKPYLKLKLESLEDTYGMDMRFDDEAQMCVNPKSEISFHIKVQDSNMKQEIQLFNDLTDWGSSELKVSLVDLETEKICEYYPAYKNIDKREIMQRFLKENDKVLGTYQENEKIEESEVKGPLNGGIIEKRLSCEVKSKGLRKERKSLELMWKIWRIYTLKERKKRDNKKLYQNKIEAFLRSLKEGGLVIEDLNAKTTKTLGKHKFREKRKIDTVFSRQNIKEKQLHIENRNLEKKEKLENIVKELKKSHKETLERLQEEENRKGKKRGFKAFTNEFKTVQEREKVFPTPKFLLRMEERGKERMNRWKEIREKRRQLEEKQEEAEKKRKEEIKAMEENEKKRKIEELREIKRIERKRKEEAKVEKERLKEQLKMAERHHEKLLLRSYGLRPWKCLMRLREHQKEKAVELSCRILALETLRTWRTNVADHRKAKNIQAEKLYNRILQKECFGAWVNVWKDALRKFQVAIDWDELRTTEKVFKKLLTFHRSQQLDYLEKKRKAEDHYKRKLKLRYLKKWQSFPEIMILEIAKEKRKQIWRQKIREILPDYQVTEASSKRERK